MDKHHESPVKKVSSKRQDPYYDLKSKAQSLGSQLHQDLQRWKGLLHSTNTHTHPEFKQLHRELKEQTRVLYAYAVDLGKLVKFLKTNPGKFNISEEELIKRSQFVNDIKAIAKEIKTELNSQRTKAKISKDMKNDLLRSPMNAAKSRQQNFNSGHGQESEASSRRNNRAYIEEKQQAQLEMEKQEEDVLDDMASALFKLEGIAGGIGNVLVEHKEGLQKLDGNVSVATSRLEIATSRIEKLIGKSDAGRYAALLFLFIVAVLELVFIIY